MNEQPLDQTNQTNNQQNYQNNNQQPYIPQQTQQPQSQWDFLPQEQMQYTMQQNQQYQQPQQQIQQPWQSQQFVQQQVWQQAQQQYMQQPENTWAIDLWDIQLDDAATAPYNPSGWQIIAKLALWFLVGLCVSFVVFGIIAVIGKNIFLDTLNPLLPLIMLLIAFLCTFIWNVAIWLVYNLVYSEKYYDMSKMFGLILLSNFLIFIVFAWLYLMFTDNVDVQFLILSFHIVFAVFISLSLIEFLSNPNYASSHLIWTMIGFVLTMMIYLIIFKTSQTWNISDNLYYLILVPPLLWYSLGPFCHALWELIYYKFYEMWNNFFYLPSLAEVTKTDTDPDEVSEDNQVNVSIE